MNEHQYIYNDKTILEQFIMFCNENKPANYKIAIEFFSVFGGLNRIVDCTKDIKNQIQTNILERYKYLRNDISNISKGDEEAHKILSAIALGDRRTNSAFRKYGISFDNGIDIIDDQCGLGMLKLEKSLFRLTNIKKDSEVSEKLIFTTTFAHYWFAFVSPVFKGVRDGDFKESLTLYENKKIQLESFVFEQLCFCILEQIYNNKNGENDEIKTIGRYWDNSGDIINLLAKTKSGEIIAGAIKYSNAKVKSSTLNELKQKCEKLEINAVTYVLFSKNGFSSELKTKKSSDLKLFTLKHLKLLFDLHK
jgi:hypothetical protein